MKTSRMIVIATVSLAVLVSTAAADYTPTWLPAWSGDADYTHQFWGLHAVGGAAPAQPMAPDNVNNNAYGTATATWQTHPQGFYGWLAAATGTHPAWVDEVWGGMVQMTGGTPINLTMNVPTGSDSGALKVYVQYDWYNYGGVTASVVGATDVTPASYYNYMLGMSGSNREWYRTTRVFEFASNPGTIDVTLTATGFAPIVDSFSVTTALDAAIPDTMPVPEPAALGLLATGLLVVRRRS